MTTVLIFAGVWFGLAAAVAIRLGQLLRYAGQDEPDQQPWRCPDDVPGRMRELEESR